VKQKKIHFLKRLWAGVAREISVVVIVPIGIILKRSPQKREREHYILMVREAGSIQYFFMTHDKDHGYAD